MAKIPEEVLLGMIANAGGGGGTSDYSQLANKPQINGVTLSGDKSASDLSLASLDANGKVPSSQLPSYVDDVVEGYYDASTDRFYEESTFETIITPVEGKSWVDIPANKSYRWTGSVYVRVDEGVQIGETSDTAYAGNKGKANADAIAAIKDGQTIDSFADVESALADKVDKVDGKVLSTNDYTDADKAIVGGVTAALASKQDALTAGANINMTSNVVKAGVVEVVEPDMTVYGNSTESGSKTYTIETTGVYEIFYCLSLQSTVSVTLPNDANVLFESNLTVSSHPVKHIVAELHEGDTVTIAQTPSQWTAVVSGVLKLDAISVVNVAHTGSVADNTITYTLPNDNKYYLVVGVCVGKPTGNNVADSTSGGNPDITRTLTYYGVRFRSVVVKGSDSPSFSFYGYDGGVASIIAYEIEFEEGNWDYNLATKNYVDTAIGAAVASAYHHAGTKTCAELVAGLLVAGNEGNVYNITDSGTTTADFIDGAGQPIKAGDNVGVARVSEGVYMFDLLSGFVDTTNFVQKSQTAGLLKNDGTVNDEIEGDVSTLKSGLTNLDNEVNGDATVYPYADVITIEDAIPANLADCNVKIEPVQDLHGYDHPWVGGAGKNKLPMTTAKLKADNVNGTWNGNVYSYRGIDFTITEDNGGNVIEIDVNGTSIAEFASLNLNASITHGSYKLNGISDGSQTTLRFDLSGIGDYKTLYNGELSVDASTDAEYSFMVMVRTSGTTINHHKVYPMLRLSTETDATFAPYTNICPISGHTEASVQRDGVNIFGGNSTSNPQYVGNYYINDGNYNWAKTMNADHNCFNVEVLPNTQYRFLRENDNVLSTTGQIRYLDANGDFISGYTINGSLKTGVITTPNGCKYVEFAMNKVTVIGLGINYPSTNTDYEPFRGKTYTIALGDTIYGGIVDFDSGVMTVTHGIVDLGTLTYTYESENTRFTANISGMKAGDPRTLPLSCECYEVIDDGRSYQDVPDYSVYNRGGLTTDVGGIHINDSRYTSPSDLATALDGMQLVYPLATPTTIQLTPQQIQLLKGQNTLTASTGQISVTVNGVSGAIGQVQEQVNELAEDVATLESKQMVKTSETVTLNANGVSRLTLTFSNGRLIYAVVISTTATYLALPYITSDKTWAVKVVDPTDMSPIASEEVEIGYGYIPN